MAFKDLAKLKSILQCPQCESPLIESGSGIQCSHCNQRILVKENNCIVFVSDELPPNYDQPDPTVNNPYVLDSLNLIERCKDGIVLDFGAGNPQHSFPNVVQLDIWTHPRIDIVTCGERLGFKDNSVDGVISLSVLEHVKDPFLYVSEIHRILKPQGTCVLHSAFLQPLHGAPYHFFNTTKHALEVLFSGFKIEKLNVGAHQHPWLTLRWFLSSYINGMPDENDRQRFRQQTVGELEDMLLQMENKRSVVKENQDLLARAKNLSTFNTDYAKDLDFLIKISPETETELAAGFELVASKAARTSGWLSRWQGLLEKIHNVIRTGAK